MVSKFKPVKGRDIIKLSLDKDRIKKKPKSRITYDEVRKIQQDFNERKLKRNGLNS